MLNKRFVSAEMFSAGVCNLNCRYCYIPKDPKISKIHKEIISKIKDGSFIKELKELYGENLEYISHWGTEPTLTLDEFIENKFYEDALKSFPKLHVVSMSSNFMTDPNILVNFISNFPEHKRKIEFKIQMSLDGPAWITDGNRCNAATEKIINNIYFFVEKINDISDDLKKKNNKVYLHFKSTHYKEEIKKLMDKERVIEYCDFFDNVCKNIIEKNKFIDFYNNCAPTLVYPGTYECQDGKNYAVYNKNFYEIYKENRYNYAKFFPQSLNYFLETIKVCDLIHTNNSQIGCSAGRSQLALSQNKDIMPCHRIFYMNDEIYDSLFGSYFTNNDYYYGYENQRDILMKKFLIANDEKSLANMIYVYTGYHDYNKLKITLTYALIKEMADCGLLSSQYKEDDKLAELLSIMIVRRECSIDNILTTGSMHIAPATSIKMFGNGVFDFYYNEILCGSK